MKLAMRRVAPRNGYGNVAEGLCRGLAEHGVTVVDHTEPAPAFLHILPPHFLEPTFAGQKKWCLTMWETDGCPEGMYAGFGNFDGIVVPTDANLASFSEWHPNVHRLDMGVDWRFWHPRHRRFTLPFRFAYTSHSPKRKGGDIAQKAAAILAREREIELVPAVGGDDEELRELLWSCHAYLQPSRGEGWGMMPHEALATGMPAVVSDCAGHREYSWLPGCYLTDTRLVPSILDFHGPPGSWWEPDLDSLVDGMRWMVDNYPEAHTAAQQAPALCRSHYDWTDIAGKLIDLIGADVLSGPDPDPVLVDPTWLTFPVTALSNLECDIGNTHYSLRKDEPVWLSCDAKRVLVTSGHVEAPC